MVYILIALALLAAITMMVADQSSDTSDKVDDSELLTTRVIAYAGTAQNVLDRMLMTGTLAANLSYLRPADAGFNTAPHLNKIYHPNGGGLNYNAATSDIFGTCTAPNAGWYIGAANNFEWTPTTTNDVILTAYCIKQSICANINKKISGSATIPTVSGDAADYFVPEPDWSTHTNFTAALCASCSGIPSFCVADSAATPVYTAYFILKGL